MQYNHNSINKYRRILKRFTMWAALIISCSILAFTYSKTAHASLFSSLFNSIIGSQSASAAQTATSKSGSNSQNMSVLVAAATPGSPQLADETVPIDTGGILDPDIASTNMIVTDASSQISTYIVRDGDTISDVAKMFNVSVNTILWANDLTSRSVLQTGQTLVILPISGITYTVKKGDTVKSIAAKYSADAGEIINYNDLVGATSGLIAGQTIVIPDAEPYVAPVVARRTTRPAYTGNLCISHDEPLLDSIRNLPSYQGYYARPIIGGRKTQCLHGHNAVDLAADYGTTISAAAPGTVIIAKSNGAWNGGYGNYVVISHPNGTQTLYAHMSKAAVTPGESVTRGQTIGYLGSTGHSTGPHVHFEIRGALNTF